MAYSLKVKIAALCNIQYFKNKIKDFQKLKCSFVFTVIFSYNLCVIKIHGKKINYFS